jgi:hypothetical protein
MYWQYEARHGRGFSFGTFFSFCIIAIYVWTLGWGWKTPVHLATRTTAGAVATAAVALLALFAITLAFVGFSSYLLLLFLLTGLSILVFIPMRLTHAVWMAFRHIAYHCPNDDCAYKGLPIHICKCGVRYSDLYPNFYGVFYHTCHHENGEAWKLPTVDWLGRNKLDRLCGGCHRLLIHSSIGELEIRPIAIVGGPSSGKSVFMVQAVNQLMEHLRTLPRATVRVDSAHQSHEFERALTQLSSGQVLAKTAGDVTQALGLVISIPKQIRCLLHLYDPPGEVFTTMQELGRKQAVQHLSGIVLLVDPFSFPALSRITGHLGPGLKPSESPFAQVVSVLTHGVNDMLGLGPQDKCQIPLAVVLSKADALPVDNLPFLKVLSSSCGGDTYAHSSDHCRSAFVKLGEENQNTIRLLEQKFARVGYFSCSALGRIPDPRNKLPFKATGVMQPILWLLGLDKSS